ncbi:MULTISPECIES: hypothetical protein [Kitasatospora]|uniref:Uncharacterized protein n=1 Tax=Kitasatospora acidiphila TaxID=2567942 RepID=A0A540W8M6_9ACTN|nr:MULTISPECIES: hypothetical protein [Kitasatospora]MDH6138680.1 hypothetical protein [Kitasatospora sp. GP30]TQF05373.1 hypothetical protein E6W39_28005 [Kitasatospora acidiphila]
MSDPRPQTPQRPAPDGKTPGAAKSLLEQLQDMLASVNADLADLGSDLEAAGARAVDEPADDPAAESAGTR